MQNSLDGILIIDKKEGISSYDCIRRIKKILRELQIKTKVGHTGTLDPFATGLMVVLFGRYTRLSDYVMSDYKTYSGSFIVGEKTDTGDLTGNVIETKDAPPEAYVINSARHFCGMSMQVPPSYSALKHNGKKLYEYAREGIFIEKPAREIFVKSFDVNKSDDGYTFVTEVSKGTYIRRLIEDYCESLSSCGHLTSLRRVVSGGYSIDSSVFIDDLTEDNFLSHVKIVEDIKLPYREIFLNDNEIELLYHGIRIATELEDADTVVLRGEKGIFAFGKIEDGQIKTKFFLR